MSKIDTQVRHVTKPGANLFTELGFSPADARRYQAESREQIDHTLALMECPRPDECNSHTTEPATKKSYATA